MGTLLESIHSPADLKRLNFAQMAELAEEIRVFLIQTLSKTGGHLGPNLGVVELTLALHAVFNTPEDKLLFDVSHQAYIHKMLTGRLDRMDTIRQPGGLNGLEGTMEDNHLPVMAMLHVRSGDTGSVLNCTLLRGPGLPLLQPFLREGLIQAAD